MRQGSRILGGLEIGGSDVVFPGSFCELVRLGVGGSSWDGVRTGLVLQRF